MPAGICSDGALVPSVVVRVGVSGFAIGWLPGFGDANLQLSGIFLRNGGSGKPFPASMGVNIRLGLEVPSHVFDGIDSVFELIFDGFSFAYFFNPTVVLCCP